MYTCNLDTLTLLMGPLPFGEEMTGGRGTVLYNENAIKDKVGRGDRFTGKCLCVCMYGCVYIYVHVHIVTTHTVQ